MKTQKLYIGLCPSRAWWPLAPNFHSQETRKYSFFYAGHPRVYSFRVLGYFQYFP